MTDLSTQIQALVEERGAAIDSLDKLVEKMSNEKRDFNADEQKEYDAKKKEVESLAKRISILKEKLERENEEGQFKFNVLKGRYIPRSEMFLHLAGRAAVLDAGVEQFFRAKSQDFIALVNGDQSKGPDFIEALIAGWKDLLDSYANSEEMDIMFSGEVIDIGED